MGGRRSDIAPNVPDSERRTQFYRHGVHGWTAAKIARKHHTVNYYSESEGGDIALFKLYNTDNIVVLICIFFVFKPLMTTLF